MYIKAWRNQGYKCGIQSNFVGGTELRMKLREGRLLFRRVSRCVRFFEQS